MRTPWSWLLVALLVGGCHVAPPPPPPPSGEFLAADADRKTPPVKLLPQLVTLALRGSAYESRVQSFVLPVPGTSGDMWLRLHLTPTGSDPRASVRTQTLDVLGRVLVPLKHHQAHRISCQISVQPDGQTKEVSVEVDELQPDTVKVADLKLGDVVPPDRISAHLTVSEDHWDRLAPAAAASASRNL